MQRNHHAEALVRLARQIPEWASWGGRSNAYAIEWTTAGSGTDFYSLSRTPQPLLDVSFVLWLKTTAALSAGTEAGIMGWYDSGGGSDVYSLNLTGTATGNTLTLYQRGKVSLHQLAAGSIGTSWVCVQVDFTGANIELHINGVSEYVSPAPPLGDPVSNITLGKTDSGGTAEFLQRAIVDEIALFDAVPSASTIYNGGVPLGYTTTDPSELLASYEVEKDVGAVNVIGLSPSVVGSGKSSGDFVLGANTTQRPQVTTDALRDSDTNPFREQVLRVGAWVSGSAVSGDYAINGRDISAEAPGLLPFPAGGGYSTVGYTGAFVGQEFKPAIGINTLVSGSSIGTSDSTVYAANGGTLSLGGVVDGRDRSLFLRPFVKR